VLLPGSAAALGLGVGSTFRVSSVSGALTIEVTGLYRAEQVDGPRWRVDPLAGTGEDSAFPDPDDQYAPGGLGFGPLLVAPGGFDAADIGLSTFDVGAHPDLSRVAPEALPTLIGRLDGLDTAVPARLGRAATTIAVTSEAGDTVRRIRTTLDATRATVVAVGAVLLVPAAAVLVAASGLLASTRTGERRLLRSRGASRRRLAALALPEGLLGAAAVLVVGPLLAGFGYRLLAAQPAMRSAGMPGSVPVASALPAAAVVAATVLVVILIAGLRPSPDTAALARQHRVPRVLRSGADLAVVVLAVAAVARLRLAGPADPVALAAPALLLLAGVLVGLRVVPLLSVLASVLAARSRGAVLALAAWQVGRRSGSATAAVLLVALAVGTGVFGSAELATWRQAQEDQARFAIGSEVRAAVLGEVDERERLLAAGGGRPAPVLRALGQLQAESGSGGTSVQVLGLPAAARRALATGRTGSSGGSAVAAGLPGDAPAASGVPVPAGTRAIAADVLVRSAPGVGAVTALVVESPHGLLRTLATPRLATRDTIRAVRFPLPVGARGAAEGWRIVGLRATLSTSRPLPDEGGAPATVAVRDLRALGADTRPIGRLDAGGVDWLAAAADPAGGDGIVAPRRGDGLALRVELTPAVAVTPTTYSLLGWQPDAVLPAVLSGEPGRLVPQGASATLLLAGVPLQVTRSGAVGHVPGAASAQDLADAGGAPVLDSGGSPTVVVDGTRLARALVVAGSALEADEWWDDVAPGRAESVVAALDAQRAGSATSAARVTEALRAGPLRVVVQPALLLAVLAGALLVAAGFAAQSAAALRARASELAQLVALGLPRTRVVGVVALESLLVCLLGAAIGVGAGLLVAVLTGPLLAVAPGGGAPFPAVRVVVPWASVAALVAEVVGVLCVVVGVTALVQRRSAPAALLRTGRDA
jgi:hypothetical protein